MKILLIDDQPQYLNPMEDYFEAHGHEFKIEDNPKGGIREALRGNYDLVITDYMMPEMRGHEVKQYLSEAKPELRVVIWSSEPSICPGKCYQKLLSIEEILGVQN